MKCFFNDPLLSAARRVLLDVQTSLGLNKATVGNADQQVKAHAMCVIENILVQGTDSIRTARILAVRSIACNIGIVIGYEPELSGNMLVAKDLLRHMWNHIVPKGGAINRSQCYCIVGKRCISDSRASEVPDLNT